MIESLAHRIAVAIKQAAPDHPASVQVLRFPIAVILNAVSIIVISILISLLTGRTSGVIMVLIWYAVLRQISGGVHLRSGDLCVVVSVTGVTLISFANFPSTVNLGLTFASVILAAIFAPSRIENQTRIPAKYHPVLKILSVILISVNLVLNSSVVATAFFVQSLTLIHGRR
jgi:accessory gene regulator B